MKVDDLRIGEDIIRNVLIKLINMHSNYYNNNNNNNNNNKRFQKMLTSYHKEQPMETLK